MSLFKIEGLKLQFFKNMKTKCLYFKIKKPNLFKKYGTKITFKPKKNITNFIK